MVRQQLLPPCLANHSGQPPAAGQSRQACQTTRRTRHGYKYLPDNLALSTLAHSHGYRTMHTSTRLKCTIIVRLCSSVVSCHEVSTTFYHQQSRTHVFAHLQCRLHHGHPCLKEASSSEGAQQTRAGSAARSCSANLQQTRRNKRGVSTKNIPKSTQYITKQNNSGHLTGYLSLHSESFNCGRPHSKLYTSRTRCSDSSGCFLGERSLEV